MCACGCRTTVVLHFACNDEPIDPAERPLESASPAESEATAFQSASPGSARASSSAAPALPQGSLRFGKNGRPEALAAAAENDTPVIDGLATDALWARAEATRFDTDFSGQRTGLATEVRFGWAGDALYVLFDASGAGLAVDTARPTNVEREKLYEEDCVELFLTPAPSAPDRYYEIELGPFGHFFDLAVHKGKKSDTAWSGALTIGTARDRAAGRYTVEVAIRSPDLTRALAPGARLPMGVYRMEGRWPRRFLAWSPPRTPKPSFHEPLAFGVLVLQP